MIFIRRNRLISHTPFLIFATISTSASLHEAIQPKYCLIKGIDITADAITKFGQVEVKATFAQSTLDIKFSVDKKNQLDVTFCILYFSLIVAQHVSGNHVPIIRS